MPFQTFQPFKSFKSFFGNLKKPEALFFNKSDAACFQSIGVALILIKEFKVQGSMFKVKRVRGKKALSGPVGPTQYLINKFFWISVLQHRGTRYLNELFS